MHLDPEIYQKDLKSLGIEKVWVIEASKRVIFKPPLFCTVCMTVANANALCRQLPINTSCLGVALCPESSTYFSALVEKQNGNYTVRMIGVDASNCCCIERLACAVFAS